MGLVSRDSWLGELCYRFYRWCRDEVSERLETRYVREVSSIRLVDFGIRSGVAGILKDRSNETNGHSRNG